MAERLDEATMKVVNRVGADVNTASVQLLQHISGLNKAIANEIVNYRNENGKFTNRKQLLKVKKLGAKAYEQCAGFMRILDGDNPLDATSVHPESYAAAEELLKKLPSIGDEQAKAWAEDNSLIPQNLRKTLLVLAADEFEANYVEKNNYYRMLHGEPNYDETGQWEGLWIDVNTINETNSNPDISTYYIDDEGTNYQLIHKLSIGYSELLYDNGSIENIVSNEDLLYSLDLTKSDVMYLKHIGSKSIEYYDARKAGQFEMLYCPSADSIEVETRFKDLFEANRLTTLYTVYSEAYKLQSEYYDRFMMIMIVIQTIIDMIVELPEYLIRRDVFDLRTCQYIFESNGVDYFPDIPIKYQVSLVKNLNKLIKFKSTDKCIVDICSIFGCDSIQVFKYYILKDRNVSSVTDAKYYNNTTTTVDGETGISTTKLDNDTNYDIKFVKVPILEPYDSYIRSSKNIYDYDEITGSDAYWTGDKDRDMVLQEIKEMDFTLLRSKYYSVEALIDIAQRTFQLVYFTNILLYNDVDKSKLLVSLPNISNKKQFELIDVIITLYALSYIYYGAEDDIMNTQGKVLRVLGFNFEADLKAIGEHLFENHGRLSLKDLHCDGFTIPEDGKILTYKQLEEIYTTNKDIYDHVVWQLSHPVKKEIYDAYKYIYDSLFIMRLNMKYFSTPTGEIAQTFTDFLSYKEPLLSSFLYKIKAIQAIDKRQSSCINAIQSITTYLKDYIDTELINFDYIFSGLPSISMDFIKKYVQEVIDFFKSFKIFTHEMSITYLFQDKFQNTIIMIDWMLLKYIFDKSEVIKIEDWIKKNYVSMTKQEKVEFIDKVWLDIDTWIQKEFADHYNHDLYSTLTKIVRDSKEYISSFDIHEQGFEDIVDEFYQMIISLYLQSNVNIDDKISEMIFLLDKEEFFNDQIQDLIYRLIVDVEYSDVYFLRDFYNIANELKLGTRTASGKGEYIQKEFASIEKSSKYELLDNYYLILTSET